MEQPFVKKKINNDSSRKRILGILGHELTFEIPITIFTVIKELAAKNNIIVYYFTTDALKNNKNSYHKGNILYNFISKKILDGLIVMSNVLVASTISPAEFNSKCRYESLPTVSLGLNFPDMPSVTINNAAGVKSAVNHLIDKHHCTRIGFLNGPLIHPEAQIRYQAYARAVADHNLALNPELVLQGDFGPSSGTRAIKDLLDNRGLVPGRDIDALVCANDYMAIMAQVKLLERGYHVPQDIAVVGFDDIIYSKYQRPALSSISNPIEKMASRAFELLLDIWDGKEVPPLVSLPAEFIPRNSCGCVIGDTNKINSLLSEDLRPWIDMSPDIFDRNITQLINTAPIPYLNLWEKTFSLVQHYNPWSETKRDNSKAADFARISYLLMNHTANKSLKKLKYEIALTSLGQALSSTLDFREIINILIKRLPSLNIRRCFLNLYENPEEYSTPEKVPPYSNLVMAYQHQQERLVVEELPPGGLRFPTTELMPAAMLAKYGQFNWIVASLYFHDEQIGFILMEDLAEDLSLYYAIRFHLSSRLKSALLLKGYQDRTRKLAEANLQIQEFVKQLKDENLRINTEMEIARNIQSALLPKNIKNIHHDFEIAALMIPATEVGGDYFDILMDEEQNLWIGIGDVSGHGLKAGITMMIAQITQMAAIRNRDITPRDVIITMNDVMFKTVTERMQQNQFMTCSILKYINNGCFQYAGMHLDFLVYRRKLQACEEISLGGVWLNLVDDVEEFTSNRELTLEIGDVLILYTDGFTEVSNQQGQLLEPEGLKKIIMRHCTKEIEAMLSAIKNDVEAESIDAHNDDMSLVLIRRLR